MRARLAAAPAMIAIVLAAFLCSGCVPEALKAPASAGWRRVAGRMTGLVGSGDHTWVLILVDWGGMGWDAPGSAKE